MRSSLRRMICRGIASILLIAIESCAQTGQGHGETRVSESRLEIDSRSPVYWVSPDEILFSAPTNEFVMEGSFRKTVSKVSIWNVRTKRMTRFAAVDGGLCYHDGNIAYWESDNHARRQWTSLGRLGGSINKEERAIRYDQTTCLPYDALPQPPARSEEHVFIRLRPEHGFIDLGLQRSLENNVITLFPPGVSKGIDLPFRRREIKQGSIKFYRFKGAYFIESSFFDRAVGYETSPWPEGLPRPVWWLYPNGKVDEIVIPYAKWMRERIVPTKAGLIALDNTFFTITGAPPHDGAYLIDGKNETRLLQGVFGSSDVSPGGCGFAVQRLAEPGTRQPQRWTLSTVNLCEEGR